MASISSDANGRKRIQFIGSDGVRRAVRLGKASKGQAEAFRVRVEHLVAASMGAAADGVTLRWLAALSDEMHGRLAAVGLVAERQSLQLGPWLEKYLAGREAELKPESRRKLVQTKAKLLAYFDPKTPLRAITHDRAADWRQWLASQGLSEAAVKTHCGNVKTIFAEADRRKLVEASPFAGLRSGSTASTNGRYVTPDEAEAILGALPDAEWRLLFGLARLAGLRIPSESGLLTWGDVDWERARLNVWSPKTEHHAGHDRRAVPITPRLMKLLQDRFAAAREGEERLVTMRGSGHVRGTLGAAIKRAGVAPWPKLFQTCRASCEQEWAMVFPQYAVSRWIGHSITVSGKHYANNVPDELFDRAAQNAAQQGPAASQRPANEKTRRSGSFA